MFHTSKWMSVACGAVLVGSLAGCATGLSVSYRTESNVLAEVSATGYGYGPKAKEMAEQAAVVDATALSEPKATTFSFMRVDAFEMLRLDRQVSPEVDVAEGKALPDGGYVITATVNRSPKAQKDMRYATSVNFVLTCKGATLAERAERCLSRAYDEAFKHEAIKKFGKLPGKARGALTFYELSRKDDGRVMTVTTSVNVTFVGAGDLSDAEKLLVFQNAWKQSIAAGHDGNAMTIYNRAKQVVPKVDAMTTFAMDVALFENSKNRTDNAVRAALDAVDLSPNYLDPLRLLFQLYKKQGNQAKLAKVVERLHQLENWEEDPGVDLTNNFKYDQKIKWTDGQSSDDSPASMIRFREVDESEHQGSAK